MITNSENVSQYSDLQHFSLDNDFSYGAFSRRQRGGVSFYRLSVKKTLPALCVIFPETLKGDDGMNF